MLIRAFYVVQNKTDDSYNVIHNRNQSAHTRIQELKGIFQLFDPWRTRYPVDKNSHGVKPRVLQFNSKLYLESI